MKRTPTRWQTTSIQVSRQVQHYLVAQMKTGETYDAALRRLLGITTRTREPVA